MGCGPSEELTVWGGEGGVNTMVSKPVKGPIAAESSRSFAKTQVPGAHPEGLLAGRSEVGSGTL